MAGKSGAKSKYKPEFCERLIKHMTEGLSYESFAGEIKVGRQTMYDWEKKHPEWLEAKDIAFPLCQLWWEKQGKLGMWDKMFNPAIWIFNMKYRFNWNPIEKSEQKTKHSGTVGVGADPELKEVLGQIDEVVSTIVNDRNRKASTKI